MLKSSKLLTQEKQMASNDITNTNCPLPKGVRNDLAKIAKGELRSLPNYLSKIVIEHHEKVMQEKKDIK